MARPGTWDLDPDGDVQLADGWERVDLLQQQSDGTFDVAASEVFALREVMNKRTAVGLMEAADVVWHLDAADLPDGVDVRTDDRVRDDAGVEWKVSSPTLAGASDQWRCPCVKVPAAAE